MSEATGTAVDARETERVARQIEQFKRKCGDHGEEALNFAYHAALPVALNPEFLHLLRINFFVDIDCPLPYEVEYEFLLSSLCRQIDEGLYEVERDVRLVLLEGLAREFGQERMREVAMLLWEYVEQQEPCSEHLGLERAQQLTSLSFLEITKAKKWLHQAQAEVENYSLEASRDWLVAMQSDVEETTEIKIRFNDLTLEGKPFQCPPLPSHYIGRPGIQEAIKNKLIDTQPSTADRLVISAVKGLGGIGKSVMASAVALDRDVQRTFSDGVLWATLGQKPDSLSHLHNWIRALGDYGKSFTSTESASIYLRTLLLEKKMLLILDDVWALEHLIPFDVGGPNCRILVTSREANIPDAECFNMDVMTSEQALALLLGKEQDYQLSETDRLAAEALVKALGYHPLALKLTKAQVAQGVDWRESLDRFKKQQVIRQRDSSLSTDLPNTDFNQTNHSGLSDAEKS